MLSRQRIFLGLAMLMMSGAPSFGQTNVGQISGTVYDATGAAVPDSRVTAVSVQTGLQHVVTTQPNGFYVFPSLATGPYNVRVEKAGFQASEQLNVILDAASRRAVDFRMNVAGVTDSVSVTAAAEAVQTTSGDVSRMITDRQVSQIALNGRNYTQLLRLIPGSVATDNNPFNLALSIAGQRINGIRSNSLYFTLDGGENIDGGGNSNAMVNPNIDTIAEVKILTASYSAEFGGRSGAVVNVVTKSGTREFHGTLFEFVRNDQFDARSFFARSVEPLRFNNFGWTLGGPIFVPKKWNTDKNKLFFFAGQEWKYNHQGTTQNNVVPTQQERAGDFSTSSLPAPVDPLNGQPFPNRVVPPSRFSRNGPPLLRPFPLPNFGGPGGNFTVSGVNRTDPREDLLKVDYILSSKTQLSYRWTHDEWNIYDPYQGGTMGIIPGDRPRPGYVTSASLNHTFSPTTMNQFSFSLTHNIIISTAHNEIIKRATLGLNYAEIYPGNYYGTGPNVTIAGFATYRSGDMLNKNLSTFQWRDDFSKVIGSHSLKFGALIARARQDTNSSTAPDAGMVTFNTSARLTSRNAVADVLLGNFQNYTESQRPDIYWNRFNQFEFYAQDSWRVNRKLTLELGLRYNLIPPILTPLGNISSFLPERYDRAKAPGVSAADGSLVPNTGDPYNGIALFGSSFPEKGKTRIPETNDPELKRLFIGLPEGGNQTAYTDFGPRFGFAYDPFGRGKTAVRGGFGLFYDRLDHNSLLNLTKNPPFNTSSNIFDGNIDSPGGGTSRNFPVNLRSFATSVKTPSVMSFNLNVQQELPGAVIVDVGYVGTLARRLVRLVNINQLPVGTRLNPPNSTINVNALVRYQGYSQVVLQDTGDNSNYNSLQVAVNRRMARGLSFGATYTFSRTLETTSGTPQDSYDARADYGLSTIHRQQVMNFNYIYELPFFLSGQRTLITELLGGWNISGVTSFQSGAPVSLTVPVDVARIGVASSRASITSNPNLSGDQRTPSHWFNAEAAVPSGSMTQGRFGNSGRNILIGPGFHQWDISLAKNFRLWEKTQLQFRAESYNTWNHPSFTAINTTVQFDATGKPSQGYGAVTAASPGRTLAFGLKLMF